MGTKKKQTEPAMKTWIRLKDPKSKALEGLRDEYGSGRTKELCGRWLQSTDTDSDGDFCLADITCPDLILKSEVARVRESIECPKDPPTAAKKAPKAKKPKVHVWEPIPHPGITARTTKDSILWSLKNILDAANALGAENAKLKNQIAKLKGAK